MSKSKILMGAGAVILTAAGVFAGKASTKFVNAPGLYYLKGATCTAITTIVNTVKLSTAAPSTHQAIMRTFNGATPLLWATAGCTTKAVQFRG